MPIQTVPFIAEHADVLGAFTTAAHEAALVSFDVFDTLLVRFFGAPEDLFRAMGEEIAHAGQPDNTASVFGTSFAQARIAAENRARDRARGRGGHEITLDAIYAELAEAHPDAGADALDAIRAREIALELSSVRADPQVKRTYDALIEAGRRVVVVSDMYLPLDVVRGMLDTAGIAGFEQLFLSSDLDAAKADGTVWPVVRARTGLGATDVIVHLGDNPASDGTAARAQGVQSFLLTPPARRHVPARGSGPAHWLNDAFSALLRQDLVRLGADAEVDPYWLAVGHLIVAPAAIGMAGFVHELAARIGTDRVFFLARDGLVFRRAYEGAWRNTEQAQSHYVWSSRRCLNLAGMMELGEAELDFLVSGNVPLAASGYLRRIDLDPAAPEIASVLRRHFPDPEQLVLTDADRGAARAMMRALETPILARAAAEREGLLAHLNGMGLFAGPGVVVDLGWHGSLQRSLVTLGAATTGDVPALEGAYLGTLPRRARGAAGAPLRTHGWLFADGEPPDALAMVRASIEVVELLFSAPEPGVRSVEIANGAPRPVRIEDSEEAPRLRLAALFHDIVARDAAALRPALHPGHVETLRQLVRRNMGALLRAPTAEDIAQFRDLTHAEGFGVARYRPIIPPTPDRRAPRALLEGLNAAFWRQAYLGSLGPATRVAVLALAHVQERVRHVRKLAARA